MPGSWLQEYAQQVIKMVDDNVWNDASDLADNLCTLAGYDMDADENDRFGGNINDEAVTELTIAFVMAPQLFEKVFELYHEHVAREAARLGNRGYEDHPDYVAPSKHRAEATVADVQHELRPIGYELAPIQSDRPLRIQYLPLDAFNVTPGAAFVEDTVDLNLPVWVVMYTVHDDDERVHLMCRQANLAEEGDDKWIVESFSFDYCTKVNLVGHVVNPLDFSDNNWGAN